MDKARISHIIYMYASVILAHVHFYRLGVPEQALVGIPLGFGIIVEDKPYELFMYLCKYMYTVCSLCSYVYRG